MSTAIDLITGNRAVAEPGASDSGTSGQARLAQVKKADAMTAQQLLVAWST